MKRREITVIVTLKEAICTIFIGDLKGMWKPQDVIAVSPNMSLYLDAQLFFNVDFHFLGFQITSPLAPTHSIIAPISLSRNLTTALIALLYTVVR